MFWNRLKPCVTIAISDVPDDKYEDLWVVSESWDDKKKALSIASFARKKRLPVLCWNIYINAKSDRRMMLQWIVAITDECSSFRIFCEPHEVERWRRLLCRHPEIQLKITAWNSGEAGSQSTA